MASLPLTRITAPPEKQEAIRTAVRNVTELPMIARLATLADVSALTALLADPAISAPIYTLPSPITHEAIEAFIIRHLKERERGEGLLLIGEDEAKAVSAYHDIQFWPQWSACELGGAIRTDRQSAGAGGAGANAAFNWLFEEIGVDLICETASLDNTRTARLLDHIGFVYKGEIESELPSGGTRPSRYWEMTRIDWRTKITRSSNG